MSATLTPAAHPAALRSGSFDEAAYYAKRGHVPGTAVRRLSAGAGRGWQRA
jgi:hypothetical protein